MKALVSGQAGMALIIEGEQRYRLLAIEMPDTAEVDITSVRILFDRVSDLIELHDIASERDVLSRLEQSWSEDRGVRLAFILLDRHEMRETRASAAESLNELLESREVSEFVANRLYSAPMPDDADLAGAIGYCESANAVHARDFLQDLSNNQGEIQRRDQAWRDIPDALFDGSADRAAFREIALRAGAFRLFVTERVRRDWALFQLLAHPDFRGSTKARNVFQSWAAPFRETVSGTRFSREVASASDVSDIRREPSVHRELSAHDAFIQAERQRAGIKRLLQEGKTQTALRFMEQLVTSQRRTGEPEHIAKSLCDLAQFAKEMGSFELQLQFALRAIQEAPEDAWAWSTLGDAYRNEGQFQLALDAFYRAGALGDAHAALLGRAEVLKDLGQRDEAFAVLDTYIAESGDDVVALNSRAAALADFGQLEDALAAYDRVLEIYPYEHVTRTGRAQVLRELGRLTDALRDLKDITRDYPAEFVPRYTQGEVIRELGRLPEALEESRKLLEEFPLEVAAKCAHARNLRDLGRFDESTDMYRRALADHPLDVSGYLGLAETLKRRGLRDEARRMYETIVAQFRRSGVARTGLASILVSQGEYDRAISLLPTNPPATRGEWVAYHIRGMALLKQEDFRVAREILEKGLDSNPWPKQREYFRTALASLRIREGRPREAVNLLQGVEGVDVTPVSHAIEMHAFGELGDQDAVDSAYETISANASPLVLRLRDALATRYSRRYRQTATNTLTDNIFAEECDSLLLAA